MRAKTSLVVAALAGLTMMLLSVPAAADVIKVHPGESIQAAIDQASPGDKIKLAPGTYRESVQIKTDAITLRGAGADETVIKPGPGSGQGICEGSDGICVADADVSNPNAPPVINNRVADVRIKDLKVKGFDFSGVFFFGTRDQRVKEVVAKRNAEYGIAAFETTGGRYRDNATPRNGEAGLYVGDSENADAVLRDNVSNHNAGIGIFIRDAAHGRVKHNRTSDNCIGVLFLDTPDDPAAPLPSSDWIARKNRVNHNNAVCSGEEGDSSGIGIAIDGAQRITLLHNTANGNRPAGPSPFGGGILVATEPGFPTATGNLIKHNTAFRNRPVDLFWDQLGSNRFTRNRCGTSDPNGLCGHHGSHHTNHKHHKSKRHHH